MRSSRTAARLEAGYAAALLALAATPQEAASCGEALDTLAAAMETSADLRDFLLNPTLAKEARKQALLRIAPNGAPKTALDGLRLLADKGYIGALPGLAKAYRRLAAAQSRTLLIQIRSAVSLSPSEEERICGCFVKRHGAAGAVAESVTDASLIGGLRVQIGDRLYDQSLAGRLEELRRVLSGAERPA